MSPADGSDFPQASPAARTLPDSQAILLHGGRALLLFEGAEAPPPLAGHLLQGGTRSLWTAECWPVTVDGADRWHGLAVLDAAPGADAELVGAACGSRWRFAAAPRLDIAVEPLADLVRRAGANGRDVFAFLVTHLLADRPAESAEAREHRAFARRFLTAAADRDGFIEVLAAPDTGGLFVQGWSLSLPAGATMLADAAEDLELREVEVAHFERDDILPPGRGFCLLRQGLGPRPDRRARGGVLRAGRPAAAPRRRAGRGVACRRRTGDRACRPHAAAARGARAHAGGVPARLPAALRRGGHAHAGDGPGRGGPRRPAPGPGRRAAGAGLDARPAAPGRARAGQEHRQPLRPARRQLVPAAAAGPLPRLRPGPAVRRPARRARRDARLHRPRAGAPGPGRRRAGLPRTRARRRELPVPSAERDPVRQRRAAAAPAPVDLAGRARTGADRRGAPRAVPRARPARVARAAARRGGPADPARAPGRSARGRGDRAVPDAGRTAADARAARRQRPKRRCST